MVRDRNAGSLREVRPGVWRLRIYVGSDPATGRPIQASRTIHTKTRGGKTEALAKLKEFVAEVEAGEHKGGIDTFGALLDEHLNDLKRTLSASTVETYRMYANKRIIPALGAIRLRDLTAHHLDRFYAELEKIYKPATIGLVHSIISGALTRGVRWGKVKMNVAAFAAPPTIPSTEDEGTLTEEDLVRLISEAEKDDPVLAAAIFLAALLGGRRGEVLGLQWGDIDWDLRTVRIRRQLVPAPVGGGQQVVPHLKGKKSRTEAIGDAGVEMLLWLQGTMRARLGESWVPAPDDWILSRNGTKPLRAKAFTSYVSALGARLGLSLSPHDFRHFAVSTQTTYGIDRATIRNRHGHSTVEVAERYTHAVSTGDYEAAALMGRLLAPALGGSSELGTKHANGPSEVTTESDGTNSLSDVRE